MGSTVACAECGTVIDQSPSASDRIPCPKCGSLVRSFTLSVQIADAITVSAGTEARFEVVTYPQTLLGTARNLIDNQTNLYGIAIIVLHIACEIATDRALSDSFAKRGIQDLEDPVCKLFRGYNLNNDNIRNLYTALTGDDIQIQPFWQKFKKSAELRNDIIHKGWNVTDKIEVEESYDAVKAFLAHLDKLRS